MAKVSVFSNGALRIYENADSITVKSECLLVVRHCQCIASFSKWESAVLEPYPMDGNEKFFVKSRSGDMLAFPGIAGTFIEDGVLAVCSRPFTPIALFNRDEWESCEKVTA